MAAVGLATTGVGHLADLEAAAAGEILVLCPAVTPTSQLERGVGGGDVEACMRELAARNSSDLEFRDLELPTLLLCPITQLNQSAALRKMTGARCTIASRPLRMAAMQSVTKHLLESAGQRTSTPWMFHTDDSRRSEADSSSDDLVEDELLGCETKKVMHVCTCAFYRGRINRHTFTFYRCLCYKPPRWSALTPKWAAIFLLLWDTRTLGCTRLSAHICTQISVHTCTHMHTRIHLCIHAHMRTCVHTCTDQGSRTEAAASCLRGRR